MTPMQINNFPTNSLFHPDASKGLAEAQIISPRQGAQLQAHIAITERQVDDWAHRLRNAADEVGDKGLLALESDLLDLRDELWNLLK